MSSNRDCLFVPQTKPGGWQKQILSASVTPISATSVALDAITNSPNSILAGDRHLAFNNQPVKLGLFSVTDNAAMGWTKELHFSKNSQTLGALVFADGHGEVIKDTNLPAVFQRQSIVTNRLVIP